jgi:hypothetical protein
MTDGRTSGVAESLRALRTSEAVATSPASDVLVLLLGGLRQLTDWDTDVLCRYLGCSGPQSEPNRVAHCTAYLEWVTDACRKVDPSRELVRARREVLVGAFELCAGAGGPASGRVARCREAMLQPVKGSFSANDLLELGEVAEAWRQAARALPSGPAREARDSFDTCTPNLRRGHLHPRRLQLLLTGDAQEIQNYIGATVALRMHTHLSACNLCKAVAAELDLRWDHAPLLASPPLRQVA